MLKDINEEIDDLDENELVQRNCNHEVSLSTNNQTSTNDLSVDRQRPTTNFRAVPKVLEA